MKARTAGSSFRRPLWPAWLWLLASLSLLVPPSQVCALIEATPGHSHEAAGHSHASKHSGEHSHEAPDADGDAHGDAHSGEHASAPGPHHDAGRLFLAPVEPSDICCGQSEPLPIISAMKLRLAAPDRSQAPVVYAPALLPRTPDIFALTACHGRDGPPERPLRSSFPSSSLLGRAPPASV